MASFPLATQLYMRDPAASRNLALLHQFLAVVQSHGYHLTDWEQEGDFSTHWAATMGPNASHYTPCTPGLSPTLQHSLVDFSSGRLSTLLIGAYITQSDPELGGISFNLECHPDDEAGTLQLHTNSKTFGQNPVHPQWLTFVHALYTTWHPLYQFPYYNVGEQFHSRDEILAHHLQWLHTEYNYFGAELVTHIGRERLLATPRVSVTEMDDGGICIGQGNTQVAAAYLGFTKSPHF